MQLSRLLKFLKRSDIVCHYPVHPLLFLERVDLQYSIVYYCNSKISDIERHRQRNTVFEHEKIGKISRGGLDRCCYNRSTSETLSRWHRD